jgi:hypothetical protein
MFHGRAAVMRRNPIIWWVFGAGIAAVVMGFAVTLLPGPAKMTVHWLLPLAMLVLYPIGLSIGLRPKFTLVDLYVDQNGVWADNAPLVGRQEIAQAYIRPAVASRVSRMSSAGTPVAVTLPAYPTTVELVKHGRGQLNIDPGNDQAAAAILTALGFPVVYRSRHYRFLMPARLWAINIVVVVMLAAALFGYMFYMSPRH